MKKILTLILLTALISSCARNEIPRSGKNDSGLYSFEKEPKNHASSFSSIDPIKIIPVVNSNDLPDDIEMSSADSTGTHFKMLERMKKMPENVLRRELNTDRFRERNTENLTGIK